MSTNVHAPSPARARAELRGSPAPLAALHAQSGRLLSGSAGGFHARLRALRGYPVVVNAWASWCVPCRQEFPIFGVASAAIGRRVAFLGLNDLDQMPGAQKFLAAHPVSYPSYEDGNGSLLRSINPVVGLPATVFYSRRGEVTYFHPGPYRSVSELLGDIRRYGEGERVAVKTSIAPKAFEGATLPPNFRVPRFSLKDQFGRPATSDQYAGRPFVLTFMHSHCHDTCPLMAQDIRGAIGQTGRRLPMLAVSVDPANDTPASARAFLARNHVSGLIRFLIGPRSALAKVWKLMGIAPEMPESSHSAYVFLVDRKGAVRTGWPADHLTPEGLAHDMLVVLGK